MYNTNQSSFWLCGLALVGVGFDWIAGSVIVLVVGQFIQWRAIEQLRERIDANHEKQLRAYSIVAKRVVELEKLHQEEQSND